MTGIEIIGFAIILLYSVIILIQVQKGTNLFDKKGLGVFALTTQKSRDQIYQVLFSLCHDKKYSVEFFDVEKGRILLSENPTLFHGGFFYPITISPRENGVLEIKISVKSKLLFSGILIFRRHRNLVNLIKLGLAAAN